MPVSRFDNPAKYTPIQDYVSQHIPLPFEELHQALATRQATHDKSLADIQHMQANAINLQSIEEHAPLRDAYVAKTNKAFTDLMNQHPDPGSAQFIKGKNAIIAQLAADPTLPILKRSIDAKKQQMEYDARMKEKGDYAYWENPKHGKPFQGINESGAPNEYKFEAYNQAEKHEDPVFKLYDKIKPSGAEAKGFNLDADGNIISIKKGQEGIARDFIHNVADQNIPYYLNTKEGRSFAKKLAYHGVTNPQDIKAETAKYMKEIGEAYVHGKNIHDVSMQYAPKHAATAKGAKANPGDINTSDSGTFQSEYKSILPETSFENGHAVIPGKPLHLNTIGGGAMSSGGSSLRNDPEADKLHDQAIESYNEFAKKGQASVHANIDRIHKQLGLPEIEGQTPEQKYAAIRKAEDGLKNTTNKIYEPTDGVRQYLTKATFVNGDLGGRQVKIADQTFRSMNEFVTHLTKLSSDERSKYIPEKIKNTPADIMEYIRSHAKVNGLTAGMGKVDNEGKDAKAGYKASVGNTDFIISADNQVQKHMTPLNEIDQQLRNPLKERKPINALGSKLKLEMYNGHPILVDAENKEDLASIVQNNKFITPEELGKELLANYQNTSLPSAVLLGTTKKEDEIGQDVIDASGDDAEAE